MSWHLKMRETHLAQRYQKTQICSSFPSRRRDRGPWSWVNLHVYLRKRGVKNTRHHTGGTFGFYYYCRNLKSSRGWPWNSNPPASASWMLGLQVYPITHPALWGAGDQTDSLMPASKQFTSWAIFPTPARNSTAWKISEGITKIWVNTRLRCQRSQPSLFT